MQRDAVGSSFIDFPPSVTTGADGTVKFTLKTTNLYKASIALPHIVLKATYAADPTVTHELDVKTIDNLGALLGRYNTSLGSGPVHDKAVEDAIAMMAPSDKARLEGLYPGLRNDLLASQAYGAAYPPSRPVPDRFLEGTSRGGNGEVLQFLNNVQWTSLSSTTGSGDDRWLLNGLDYGPLFVEGDKPPGRGALSAGRELAGRPRARARPVARAEAYYYSYTDWKSKLADPQLLAPARPAWTCSHTSSHQARSPETNGPSQHYPINGEPSTRT